MWIWMWLASADASPQSAPGPVIHISIDDAPWQTRRPSAPVDLPPEVVAAYNRSIVHNLEQHSVPASVFFNCSRMQPGDDSIAIWSAYTIGNHTAHHKGLNKTPPTDWLADATSCHQTLAAALPTPPTAFRYPHLQTGPTVEIRDEIAQGLKELGYYHAPVTVANSEWVYAFAYRKAKADGDAAQQEKVVAAYRKHMLDALAAAQARALVVTGHDVPQIVLVHVNELSADHLGDVLSDYEKLGAKFVSLEEAMRDPVYALPDVYAGKGGMSWLYRVDPPTDSYWFGEEEERILAQFPME